LTVLSAEEQLTQLEGRANNLFNGRVLASNDACPLLSALDIALAGLDADDSTGASSSYRLS
jgi:hypothetical protein